MAALAVDMAVDALAVQLQMQELQAQLQLLGDSRVAQQLVLESMDSGSYGGGGCLSFTLDDEDAIAFHLQLELLQAAAAEAEAQQAVSVVQEREEQSAAEEEASAALAAAIVEQEAWDERVRHHDRVLAQRIARTADDEWENRGDEIELPLRNLPTRPAVPEHIAPGNPSAASPATPSAGGAARPAGQHDGLARSSSMAAATARSQAVAATNFTRGRGAGASDPPGSSSGSSSTAHGPADHDGAGPPLMACGICLDSLPATVGQGLAMGRHARCMPCQASNWTGLSKRGRCVV